MMSLTATGNERPKNLAATNDLRDVLSALMGESSRINSQLPERYWYPLSRATYDVEEVLEAVDSLCSFRTTMWEKTAQFESEFAAMFGNSPTAEAVMVNSGSSADLLAAFAVTAPAGEPLRPGDEVLVPAVTWPTQLWSAMMAGLRPVLVDVDPRTMNIDFDDLERKTTERTRALSLVHLMGNPVDMDRAVAFCEAHDLVLLEDCCESLGASWKGRNVGTFGSAAAYSFFFSHHITTMEGGMVLTDDPERADLLRLLRAHGWSRNLRNQPIPTLPGIDSRYTFLNWGFNVRPTELQAGFGLVQLRRVKGFQDERNRNAEHFQAAVASIQDRVRLMEVSPGGTCSWFALPFVVSPDAGFTRDQLTAHLEENGVETRALVAGNLARHPALERFDVGAEGLVGAESIHEHGFYLGLHPIDARDQLDRLAELMIDFVER